MAPAYRRVLLKLSGEIFSGSEGGFGIDAGVGVAPTPGLRFSADASRNLSGLAGQSSLTPSQATAAPTPCTRTRRLSSPAWPLSCHPRPAPAD